MPVHSSTIKRSAIVEDLVIHGLENKGTFTLRSVPMFPDFYILFNIFL